jgi:hypothetical protein
MLDPGAGEPGGIRREIAGGQVCERAVDEVGDHLPDDGVVAVVGLSAASIGSGLSVKIAW